MQVRAWMLLPMLMPTLATTAIATPARTSPKPPPPLSSCAQVSVELPAAMARTLCSGHPNGRILAHPGGGVKSAPACVATPWEPRARWNAILRKPVADMCE